MFDIIVSGGRDSLSFTGLEPALPEVEKLPFEEANQHPLEKTYILCTKNEFATGTKAAQKNNCTRRKQMDVPRVADIPGASRRNAGRGGAVVAGYRMVFVSIKDTEFRQNGCFTSQILPAQSVSSGPLLKKGVIYCTMIVPFIDGWIEQ